MSTTNAMTTDIEGIRERAAAATPGPWEVTADGGTIRADYPSGTPGDCAVIVEDSRDFHDPDGPRTEDMEFLAAARQDVPALLAVIDHLTEKHAEALALAMRRGEEISRLHGELRAATS